MVRTSPRADLASRDWYVGERRHDTADDEAAFSVVPQEARKRPGFGLGIHVAFDARGTRLFDVHWRPERARASHGDLIGAAYAEIGGLQQP